VPNCPKARRDDFQPPPHSALPPAPPPYAPTGRAQVTRLAREGTALLDTRCTACAWPPEEAEIHEGPHVTRLQRAQDKAEGLRAQRSKHPAQKVAPPHKPTRTQRPQPGVLLSGGQSSAIYVTFGPLHGRLNRLTRVRRESGGWRPTAGGGVPSPHPQHAVAQDQVSPARPPALFVRSLGPPHTTRRVDL
jgi:hypothetical protein